MSARIVVSCPRCDADIVALVTVDPGEKAVLYYSDGSGYPGSPPAIESIDDIQFDCTCAFEALAMGTDSDYDAAVEAAILDAELPRPETD